MNQLLSNSGRLLIVIQLRMRMLFSDLEGNLITRHFALHITLVLVVQTLFLALILIQGLMIFRMTLSEQGWGRAGKVRSLVSSFLPPIQISEAWTVGQLIDDYRNRYGNIGQAREVEVTAPRQETTRQPAPGVAGPAPVSDVAYGREAGRGEPLRPISQQDMESVRSRVFGEQRPASGGEGEGGLGSAIMNEKFLVPLLAGLSGMASSPSRYLGSAIPSRTWYWRSSVREDG